MLMVMRSVIVTIGWGRWTAAAFSLVLLSLGSVAAAPQERLRAERVVDFALGKAATLDAQVGPVRVQSVEFSDRGRASNTGLASRIKGGSESELSTTIRSHFLA